jgi:hypothetical protein
LVQGLGQHMRVGPAVSVRRLVATRDCSAPQTPL